MRKQYFLLVFLLLAACQAVTSLPETTPGVVPPTSLPTLSPAPQPTQAALPPANPQGSRLVLWHAMNGAAAETLLHMVAAFNTENPWDITVYPRQFAALDALQTALDEESALPNLAVILPDQIPALDAQRPLLDMTPYWSDADWGFSAAAQTAFYPALLASGRIDGRLLGLPAQVTARGLFYNRTWAQELGFTVYPQDADAFRQQVCAANQSFRLGDDDETNDGFGGWLVDGDPLTALGWFAAFDGGPLEDETYALRSDENIAALTYVKTLFDEACAWMVDAQGILPPYYEQFASRRALVISGNVSELPALAASLQSQESGDVWQLIPFPGPRRGAYVLSGTDFVILPQEDDLNLAAWLFLRWMLRPEQQVRWASETGYLPARQDAYQAMTAYRHAHPPWDEVTAHLDLAVNAPSLPSWGVARQVMGDGFYILFYQNWPIEDIPALLDKMQETIESLEE